MNINVYRSVSIENNTDIEHIIDLAGVEAPAYKTSSKQTSIKKVEFVLPDKISKKKYVVIFLYELDENNVPFYKYTRLDDTENDLKSFDDVCQYLLNAHNIQVLRWHIVDCQHYIFSNAIFSTKYRDDIGKIDEYHSNIYNKETKQYDLIMPREVYQDAIDYFVQHKDTYQKQPVYSKIIFTNDNELLSYQNFGFFIFNNKSDHYFSCLELYNAKSDDPDKYFDEEIKADPDDFPRLYCGSTMVIKGNDDYMYFGIYRSSSGEPRCQIYDREQNKVISSGKAISITLNFINLGEVFSADSGAFNPNMFSEGSYINSICKWELVGLPILTTNEISSEYDDDDIPF